MIGYRLKAAWNDLKLRWRLARHGEVMILNAIDAIESARINCKSDLFGPAQPVMAELYHGIALGYLKRAIGYEDEPDDVPAIRAAELEDCAEATVVPGSYPADYLLMDERN